MMPPRAGGRPRPGAGQFYANSIRQSASTSSMRRPIHRMTLTAMLLPSARPPPAQTRQGDPRGFDGGLPASELRGLGAGTGRERVGGWVQGIPRETFGSLSTFSISLISLQSTSRNRGRVPRDGCGFNA